MIRALRLLQGGKRCGMIALPRKPLIVGRLARPSNRCGPIASRAGSIRFSSIASATSCAVTGEQHAAFRKWPVAHQVRDNARDAPTIGMAWRFQTASPLERRDKAGLARLGNKRTRRLQQFTSGTARALIESCFLHRGADEQCAIAPQDEVSNARPRLRGAAATLPGEMQQLPAHRPDWRRRTPSIST